MILAVAIGFALSQLAGWREALPWSLVGGVLLAMMVPAKSCGVRIDTDG